MDVVELLLWREARGRGGDWRRPTERRDDEETGRFVEVVSSSVLGERGLGVRRDGSVIVG